MLLQRLTEYADRLDLPPKLYSSTPIRYIIELGADGRLLNPEPTDTADPTNKRTQRGVARRAPEVQRANVIRPLLLADKGDYTFGRGDELAKPARVAACHAKYVELVGRCAEATDDPAVKAVRSFLHDDPQEQLRLPADYDSKAKITFRVDGEFVIDRPAVQLFWAAEHDPDAAPESAVVRMQCIICGQERPVLDRLQGKIKGVPGGQTSGTSIISANAKAFESYGLEASLIAPTCAECGEKFTKGLNDLLSQRHSRLFIGGAAFVFWTREVNSFDLMSFLSDPQPDEVRQLIGAVYTGARVSDLDDTAFYATMLTGSGGRTVVRDWIDTTVGDVRRHLAGWFQNQRIVDTFGAENPPLGLYGLAGATVRELADLPPTTSRALLRSALTGTPLPYDLLYQAVRRNRAEQKITRQRAALIKLVLLSQSRSTDQQEDSMVQLDLDNSNPAYRCGRLLAVLEQVQRVAIPGAGATIVDRFFGTASSAPASVFGRLLRGAQPHLAKIERDRPGAYVRLQQSLEEIQSGLSGFPRTLGLTDQALFALGYYHQRAFDNARAREAKAARQSAKDASDEASSDA